MRTTHYPSSGTTLMLAGFLALVPTGMPPAQHVVQLRDPNTVPSYCQEQTNWCGAACAEMILEGYPGGAEHKYAQNYIWNRIQAHKKEGWNGSDPDGLQGALMELGGDPGVHWVIFANPTKEALMYSVAYWMTVRHYPTATLVQDFDHWVVVEGFETDADPRSTSSVTLKSISVASPVNCAAGKQGADQMTLTGSAWYTFGWDKATGYTTKWNGKFVAVIEPPLKRGVAHAPPQPTEGRVIPPDDAVKHAGQILTRLLATDRTGSYKALRGTTPLRALMVNRKDKSYYLVPLGRRGAPESPGAILINPYSGELVGAGVLAQPMPYLPEGRAVDIARKFLGNKAAGQKLRSAELSFRFTDQTRSWLRPAWVIQIGDFNVYVTQEGTAYAKLTSSGPGN